MNDLRLTNYDTYMNSYSKHEIENEARNARLLKQLNGNRKTTMLTVRIVPLAIVIATVLLAVIK